MPRDILDHLPEEGSHIVPADRGKRFFAFLIDILPITLLTAWVFYSFFGFDEVLGRYLAERSDIETRLLFIEQRGWIRSLAFLAWIVYSLFMDGSPRQGTLGKQWMGIKVVDEYGLPLNLKQAAVRNLGKVLSYLPLSLGFFWILFDKQRQGWHDKMARTFVVEK